MISDSTKRLGMLFESSRQKGKEGLPLLSVTLNDGLVIRDFLDRRMKTNLTPSEHLMVQEGDIAYNMMRVWQGALGRAFMNGLVSPAYVVLRPTQKIDSFYAEYLFKTPRLIYLFWAYSYGLTKDRLRLYYKDFSRIPITIPKIGEQRKIAKILSTWDKAIATTEKLIATSKQQKKALMQQLLTGKRRLLNPETGRMFEGEWNEVRIKDVIKSLDAGISVNSEDDKDINSEFKILKTSCVSLGIFDRQEAKSVKDSLEIKRLKEPVLSNSIIISRMNTPLLVGANAYIKYAPNNTFLPDRLWQVKSRGTVNVRWLGYWFSSSHTRYILRSNATGTSGSMKNITKPDVMSMRVQLPTLPEQQKIAQVLRIADQEIELLQYKLAHFQQEKKALMQQLLTGKRRVKIDDVEAV